MDSKDDITTQILVDIHDEIRGTNKRLDETNKRLDDTKTELSNRIDELGNHLGSRIDETNQRIVHSEIRLATAVTELAGSVNDVKTMLRGQLDLRDRVAKCEADIAELKQDKKKPH